MNKIDAYRNQIYSGVLGKIIGVYLGRPVEGWAYERIIQTFDEVRYYVHEACGVPLIVADDDISGTFAFFRALADNGNSRVMSAEMVGDTWLNYIIEDKTILWWGGLGRSTEHTAFLNLKNGLKAPESGSIARNGRTLAEQIGAQIFIDAFAMACPDDPELAVRLIHRAASVSHDGLAVQAAGYLGAMEAMAFSEPRMDMLMQEAERFVSDLNLRALIDDVRNICAAHSDWREVRAILDSRYGYNLYPGCCHMVPNHAMVLASLILGGDSFQDAIRIAASAGWDTDCNAGNVGCLNGIRLGLDGIDAGADFRTPVADRLLVVTSDGGSVISDAVLETRKIIRTAAALRNEPAEIPHERFDFEFPGSLQGFAPCPYGMHPNAVRIRNIPLSGSSRGLEMSCTGLGDGMRAEISTPTFLERSSIAKNFSTIASPTLYEGQTVRASLLFAENTDVHARLYALYYDVDDQVCRVYGPEVSLQSGKNLLNWAIPDLGGMPVFRIGISLTSMLRFDGSVILEWLDWTGAPQRYQIAGMHMTSIWNTMPSWLMMWTSSAKNFQADFKYTLCLSHPEQNGLATIGTSDWRDYRVQSRLLFSLHKSGGLVARSVGHRRYYAARLCDGSTAEIVCMRDGAERILASIPFSYEQDRQYDLCLEVRGNCLRFDINGKTVLDAVDNTYCCGAAGLVVSCGTFTADGFTVCAC